LKAHPAAEAAHHTLDPNCWSSNQLSKLDIAEMDVVTLRDWINILSETKADPQALETQFALETAAS